MQKFLTAILFVLLLTTVAHANPFTGKNATKQTVATEQSVAPQKAGFFATPYSKLLRQVNTAQRSLRKKMSALGREIKRNPNGDSFWAFLMFSFLYGVIHAIGPGHGKSIVFSYFLGRKGTLWKGVLMGHLLTAVHTLSAIVVVLGAYYLLNLKGSTALTSASEPLRATSYYLIIGLGVFIVLHALYELVEKRKKNQPQNKKANSRGIITVSLVAGLVPCPGAALLLSFALGLNLLTTGLLATLFFTLGMGITTSLFGIVSINSRKMLMHVAGRGSTMITVLHSSLALLAGLLIIGTGWMLLTAMHL